MTVTEHFISIEALRRQARDAMQLGVFSSLDEETKSRIKFAATGGNDATLRQLAHKVTDAIETAFEAKTAEEKEYEALRHELLYTDVEKLSNQEILAMSRMVLDCHLLFDQLYEGIRAGITSGNAGMARGSLRVTKKFCYQLKCRQVFEDLIDAEEDDFIELLAQMSLRLTPDQTLRLAERITRSPAVMQRLHDGPKKGLASGDPRLASGSIRVACTTAGIIHKQARAVAAPVEMVVDLREDAREEEDKKPVEESFLEQDFSVMAATTLVSWTEWATGQEWFPQLRWRVQKSLRSRRSSEIAGALSDAQKYLELKTTREAVRARRQAEKQAIRERTPQREFALRQMGFDTRGEQSGGKSRRRDGRKAAKAARDREQLQRQRAGARSYPSQEDLSRKGQQGKK